jgi:5-hydroxyisourate hydrolase
MSSLSTHVLDSVTGRPAEAMTVRLEALAETGADTVGADTVGAAGLWRSVGTGRTDADGRLTDWGAGLSGPGVYRLTFQTGDWFAEVNRQCFYPEVTVTFTVDTDRHYHVPLLLAPYAYSTYRGS